MLRGIVPQNTFLLITSLIFNGFSIWKKVLESLDSGLCNATFRFSLSYSSYRIVVVHVIVQTGNALPRQKNLLDVTTRIDRVFPAWTMTWTMTIQYKIQDRLNLKVALNSPKSQLPKLFQMENPLKIKEVMSK